MEEILASIRRIIEDNEAGRRQDRESEAPVEAPVEFSSFHAELRPANLPYSRATESRPEGDEGFTFPGSGKEEEHGEVEKATNYSARDIVALGEVRHEEAEDRAVEGSEQDRLVEPTSIFAGEMMEEKQKPAPAAPSGVSQQERTTILSDAPRRQAAAAFEELNEALLEMRRQRLDQMVDELLRPMLQDWLDNNLPQLVERLVREEIERIARG